MTTTVEELVAGYLRANSEQVASLIETTRHTEAQTDDHPVADTDIEALAQLIESGRIVSSDTLETPDPHKILSEAIEAYAQDIGVVLEEWAMGIEIRNGNSTTVMTAASGHSSAAHVYGILEFARAVIIRHGVLS